MLKALSQVQSLSWPWFKLGDVFSILQFGIQHTNRAIPNMHVLQMVLRDSGPEDEIHWAQVVGVREMVVQVLGCLRATSHNLVPTCLDHLNLAWSIIVLFIDTVTPIILSAMAFWWWDLTPL